MGPRSVPRGDRCRQSQDGGAFLSHFGKGGAGGTRLIFFGALCSAFLSPHPYPSCLRQCNSPHAVKRFYLTHGNFQKRTGEGSKGRKKALSLFILDLALTQFSFSSVVLLSCSTLVRDTAAKGSYTAHSRLPFLRKKIA